MWCSRRNGRLLLLFGLLLIVVGIGLAVVGYGIPGIIAVCAGLFPLCIGFFVIVTNTTVEDRMWLKRQEERAQSGAKRTSDDEKGDQ